MNRKWRLYRLIILSFLGSLLLSITYATPSLSHWADLAVAEVVVGKTETQITLTFPTGLVASADNDGNGELSPNEIRTNQAELQNFLKERIRLIDGENHNGILSVKPSETSALPSNLKVATGTHSTLLLVYTWPKPVQGLKIHYDLFLPGVPTARCLATISPPGQVQNFIFSPENRELSLMPGLFWQQAGTVIVALAGAFVWGAMHAMSPGHGKTIVGAYLAGSRATPQHAVFLGLTTTIAHTIGVFALGLVTLFASNYILPEQLYPWLSFLSGLMVIAIGLNMFISRMRSNPMPWRSLFKPSHVGHHHHHDHQHHHHHDHHHAHGHSHGEHSHLPTGADGAPVNWRSLLALSISGGLLPCPSALVMLLSAIAVGQIGFGLVMVLVFSLGLAGVLTGLGLLLVFSKRLFERLPKKVPVPLLRVLPALSALFVALIGLGITTQALMQIGLVKI